MKNGDGRGPAAPAGEGTEVGDALVPLEIPVTRTLIVAGALASRDYQDVHHDAERAVEKGSPDIFMNILTTNGLVGRFITDHFGPAAVLRKVAIRLGAPNYPGDTMVLTGTVTAVTAVTAVSAAGGARVESGPGLDEGAEERVVEVAVVGTNRIGRHVTGRVTVVLPGASTSRGVTR